VVMFLCIGQQFCVGANSANRVLGNEFMAYRYVYVEFIAADYVIVRSIEEREPYLIKQSEYEEFYYDSE